MVKVIPLALTCFLGVRQTVLFKVNKNLITMAVRENPYNKWLTGRESSDYRCTDTQVTSLVRQQLSQAEYLRTRNRVNPGPYRVKRTKIANSTPQVPHVFGPQNMWGWQPWTDPNVILNLYSLSGLSQPISPIDIPGATYYPYNRVGGATYVETWGDNWKYESDLIDAGSPMSITPQTYINGIAVHTDNLVPPNTNMVLIYKADLKKFIFVPAHDVVGYADGNGYTGDIDFGQI